MGNPQYLQEVHGAGTEFNPGEIPMDVQNKFGKAVMVIAAADGVLSSTEREYFLDMARGFGASESVIEEYRKYDPSKAKLEDLLSPDYRHLSRHFIYDAIKVASVDGYHEKEQAAVYQAAKALGIDKWTVKAIEAVIETEKSLRVARLTLLTPPK